MKTTKNRSTKSKKPDVNFHIRKRVATGASGIMLGALAAGPVGAVLGGIVGAALGTAAEKSQPSPRRKAAQKSQTEAGAGTRRPKRTGGRNSQGSVAA